MRRALIASGILFSLSSLLLAQALFPKPVKVAGDPNFIATAASPTAIDTLGPNYIEGRELNSPEGIALDTSVSPPIVYIADTGNHRVLGYRYATQLVAGAHADIVIGQVDFYTNGPQNPANGGRQSGLNNPSAVAVDSSGNLYVADTGNNRILRFPQPFNSANAGNQQPNLVIGQKTFGTSAPNFNGLGASTLALNVQGARSGLTFDASGNLWVSDTGNSRVLRFPAAALATGAPFPAADLLLGQATFTTVPTSASQIRTNLTILAGPCGLAFDASGNLYVTDLLFRVMVYNAPFTTGQSANAALGIDSTVSASTPTQIELTSPLAVVFPGTGINFGPIVADTANNRLMIYPPQTNWPSQGTQFSPSAVSQLGQPSFTVNKPNQGNGDASANTFVSPLDFAATSTELYVVDNGNNRVLVFPYNSTSGVGPAATRVIGQLDFPYRGVNLVDGKGFSFAGGLPAGAVLDTSATPAHLYVPDTLNNRILGFKDFTGLQDGQPADLVIGQPDFNRAVINYPSGNTATPTASSLFGPTSLVVDSAGNLYVTDTGNSRVLRFPAPYASGTTKLESADLVLGQSGFTSYITDATSATLNSPVGLALTSGAANAASTSGFLAVADYQQNRVLLFAKPFVSGMSASVVLGQPNMTASGASGAATGLNLPRAVAVDPQDRILVADTSNGRVQIFDQAAHLSSFAAALISLGGFAAPTGVSAGPSGDFWVADFSGNRMYHYPSVAALPLANNASDTSFPVNGPHSGLVDPFNNLLVTDSISRLLYFTPQVSYQNAANYSSRPLAAGTIVALYPTLTTNSIAEGTATAPANQFPIQTTLADTQVTVNGTPVPLYFVSPGQDNIILPQGLPTAGTANLLVVRPSTGQILGAAELPLQTTSPALFTNPSIGSGQLLAVNFQDGTTNGGTHPVVRGQFVILYGTGVGPVPSPPADGAASTGQSADDLPQVYIQSSGGTTANPLAQFIPCTVTYSGLAPGFAGLWQINVQIPQNAQSGTAVVLKLFEKDVYNLDQSSSLTTTLAVN